MRVLIAGVGYSFLRDLSVGPRVVPRLRAHAWPDGVDVEDLSFGPIAIVQRLEERPGYYDRIIFISAAERGGTPGELHCYRWDGTLPDADEIQQRVGEAVMGVISLDNLLVITQYFGVLPDDVIVLEVEPEDTSWGEAFTPRVAAALDEVVERLRRDAQREGWMVTDGQL